MLHPAPIQLREACPPGTCTCGRDDLLDDPSGDVRILKLTKSEEKKLIARIEAIATYSELQHLVERMQEQLGIILQIMPGANEVRTVRGLNIRFAEQAGLCSKTRQSIPAAMRRCFEKNPDIVYAILNAHDLLGMG